MKSMVSNRTKTETGRVTVSLSEIEALNILEYFKERDLEYTDFCKHIESCLLKLNEFEKYNSAWIED